VIGLMAALLLAASAQAVEGEWLVQDRSAMVTLARCGGDRLCGRITRILKPGPRTDLNNPDPKLRSRSFQNLEIISGFALTDGDWQGGRIYDPNTGRTYKSKLALNRDGSLKVSGCIAFICQSQRWTRPR
jgi:uncharacterized protein (DUF2147 family)